MAIRRHVTFDRCDLGRHRRAPKFPSSTAHPLPAALPPPHRRRGALRWRPDPREDGGGGHLRPGRRRLPPLLDDPAGSFPTSRRCSTTTPCSPSRISRRGRRPAATISPGDAGDPATTWAGEMTSPGGRLLLGHRRRQPQPDGEKKEGWFFTWTPAEIEAAVGADAKARVVNAFYGVTRRGNHEGRNILHAWRSADDVARGRRAVETEALRASRTSSAPTALRGPQPARGAAARREDPRGLERPDDLGVRAAGFALGEPEYVKPAERRGRLRARPNAERRASAPRLRGRPRLRARLPRRLRLRDRRPARPLRGRVRSALAARALALQRFSTATMRRDGRRLLQDRRRSREP